MFTVFLGDGVVTLVMIDLIISISESEGFCQSMILHIQFGHSVPIVIAFPSIELLVTL